MKHFGDRRDWMFEERLGLFLHFGIYAVHGWHEQEQWRRRLPRKEYERLAREFNPAGFDPDAIIDLARSAGMSYLCITTKHHDGFCLWDTAYTDYKITNTPYGRDLLRELADACHRRRFGFGLYYSIADWHHPNYPNQGRHHELPAPEAGDRPDWDRYMEFLKAQVRELCTNYGPVCLWFWDMNVPEVRDASVNEMMRSLHPGMVINERGFDGGDYGTPERDYQAGEYKEKLRFDKPTIACNSVGAQSWGYRADEDYYSERHLTECMDSILARGGGYLLNVGPDGDGRIPAEPARLLQKVGDWYRRVREAFDGCEPAPEFTHNRSVWITRRDATLYVHLHRPPAFDAVILDPMSEAPRRAVLLNTGEPVLASADPLPWFWKLKEPYLRIARLPVNRITNEVMVVRMEYDRLPTPTVNTASAQAPSPA